MKHLSRNHEKDGVQDIHQLKTAYMTALIAEGKVSAIKGGRGQENPARPKQSALGKEAASIISKEL